MANNYTPLDPKKYPIPAPDKNSSKLDAILIGIIVITFVVLGLLLFMLFQKRL